MTLHDTAIEDSLVQAINDLEQKGYTVIEDGITAEEADELAQRCAELHRREDLGEGTFLQRSKDGRYETLFGLQNAESLSWRCAAHPQVLAVARFLLGDDLQLAECASKIVFPGFARGTLHVDSAQDLRERLPDVPWLLNTMWMLTDFTYENGATLVVPRSHLLRQRPPAGWSDWTQAVPMTGRKGSVAIFRSGVWHAIGHNASTDGIRVGLNAAYYPAWWNLLREANHQPIRPEVFAQMPPELQAMQNQRVGRTREEVYG